MKSKIIRNSQRLENPLNFKIDEIKLWHKSRTERLCLQTLDQRLTSRL